MLTKNINIYWGITSNIISNNNTTQHGFLANTEHRDNQRLISENLVTTVWKDLLATTGISLPLEQWFSTYGLPTPLGVK